MRIAIDVGTANNPDALQWLDRVLTKFEDGWHVWDTDREPDPEVFKATSWLRDVGRQGRRVSEMFVASIQRNAWTSTPHVTRVRVTMHPDRADELRPEDAARLAEEPLVILVENRNSDGAFLERVVQELDKQLHGHWRRPGKPIRLDSVGGLGQMPDEVERRVQRERYRPRLVAIGDSDRDGPDDNDSDAARNLRRTCRNLGVPCWILAKREAENYLPRILLSERKNAGADHARRVEDELAGYGFGNHDRVLLLRSVLAALGRDIYAKDWVDLMVKPEVREQLPDAFESAASGIRGALVFLKELGATSDRLLPYGLQLVLLGEFFRLCPHAADGVVDLLRRWFWVTSFTGWFGRVNTAQATQALVEIRSLANRTGFGFSAVDLDAPARPFPERFDGRSARVRAFLLYLASLHPRSLHSQRVLDPGQLLADHGVRAVGYVSSSAELPRELFGSPANRVFFDTGQVGQAFLKLGTLDDDTLAELLPTHGFPVDSLRWIRGGNRVGLLEARLENLIADERTFMKERRVSLPTERTAANIADSEVSDDE